MTVFRIPPPVPGPQSLVPAVWAVAVPGPCSRLCLYDRVSYSTPVPGSRFPPLFVAFLVPGPRSLVPAVWAVAVPGPCSRLGLSVIVYRNSALYVSRISEK